MNQAQLLAHFDRISDAPDAVPRLRRFILDLAVRGRLVEQGPNDEPVSVLLERIQAEKARLTREGPAKERSIPALSDEDVPFEVPVHWAWSQLAEIGLINPRNSAADDLLASFVPMTLIPAEYGAPSQCEVRPWGEIRSGFTHFADGDVALAKITPCFQNGKSTVFRGLTNGIGAGTTELHVVRPLLVHPNYLLVFLKCSYFIETGIPRMTGTAGQKRISTEYFAHSPLPLPPLAEQQCIVGRVDELMALCDRLEAAQAERESRRDRLAARSLHRLNQPDVAGDGQAFREHANFHLQQLPRLTTRPEHIKQLRQTILNIAVRGQLVPQDPGDEPVPTTLGLSDKVRAAVAKEDRRADSENQILLGAERCRKVPPSWEWRGLADLVLFIDYRGKTPAKVEGGVRLITAKNVRRGSVSLSPEEFISEEIYTSWMTRGFPREGDVLFTTEAPMGNAAVVRLSERFALAQRVICLRPYGAVNPDFLVLQVIAEPFQSILDSTATGLTAKGIKAAKLKRLPVAVPPLAEQYRIVAKVDQLMALCDQLEAQLTTAQSESRRLLESVLHRALNSSQQVA
jgi:type I restriction enzyme S subunit